MSNNKTEETVEAAIYKGSFWNNPLSEVAVQKPLRRLNAKQIKSIEDLLAREQHKDAGVRVRGIPDRTLVLPQEEIRIVYGGSMADEIGVHGLHGDGLQGIFHSEEFLKHLNRIEGFRRFLRNPILMIFFASMLACMLLSFLLVLLLRRLF